MAPLRGWKARGERLVGKAPHGRWRTLTFLAALRCDRIEAPCLFDGPINGRKFLTYVQQFLLPTLHPGDVVVMDNLGSHKGQAVRQPPVAPPDRFDAKAMALKDLHQPVVSARYAFLGMILAEGNALTDSIAEVEDSRLRCNGGLGFAVKQQYGHEALATRLQNARKLADIVLDSVRKHVRKNGRRDREIKRVVGERKAIVSCQSPAVRVMAPTTHIGEMEFEVRQQRLQIPPAPCDQFHCDIKANISPSRA